MTRSHAIATLGAIAEAQWGLVTARQATRNGVSAAELTRLTDDGVLDRVAFGVYRLPGSPSGPLTELRAAWLQLDPGTEAEARDIDSGVVSHGSASLVLGVGDFTGDVHEFTCPKRKRSRRADVTFHTSPVRRYDIVWHDQLPVTAPARLVGDLLADRHDGQHISHVVTDILDQGLATRKELADAAAPHAAAYGVTPAREFLDHLISLTRAPTPRKAHGSPQRSAVCLPPCA
ncbi:type IV toxin-antitoxin system AbiEi family antitoxin domain-containing protein [Microtetraspora malaysiensis]|uniref:type IV toxin-antitoxin system AbiEi family antitoxin domain-containing protein n=1 Tax=Microtetraspora malaysiensis TaxID=161358 RepID=UPI003D8F1DE6